MSKDLLHTRKIKDNSRRKGVPAMKKAKRREEAVARQAAYDKLSLEEKLARPNLGAKEKAKLLAKMAASK